MFIFVAKSSDSFMIVIEYYEWYKLKQTKKK